jgi:hypothetical protein
MNANSSKTLHLIRRVQPRYLIHTSIISRLVSNHIICISLINHYLHTPYSLGPTKNVVPLLQVYQIFILYFRLHDLHCPDQPLLHTSYSFAPNMIAVPCLRILLYILSLYPFTLSLLTTYVLFRS